MLTIDDKKIRTVDSILETLAQGIGAGLQSHFPGENLEKIMANCPSATDGQRHFAFAIADPSTMVKAGIHYSNALQLNENDLHKIRTFRNAVVHKKSAPLASVVALDRDRVNEEALRAIKILETLQQSSFSTKVKQLLAFYNDNTPDWLEWSEDIAARDKRSSPQKPPTRKTTKVKTIPLPEGLSPDQDKAVRNIVTWFSGTSRRFVISGAAGTGKTRLIPAVLGTLKLSPHEIKIVAPTRKACKVLKDKLPERLGFRGQVSTLQSLLYKYRRPTWEDEDMKFEQEGKKEVQTKIKLVICDEASMLTNHDVEALETGYRVIYFGDAMQLPPVITEEEATESSKLPAIILLHPDCELTTIHRQSSGSSIVEAAQIVRSGADLQAELWDDNATQIFEEEQNQLNKELFQELIKHADAVLVARNVTRIRINQIIRRLKSFERSPGDIEPKPGERLIVDDKTSFNDFIGQPALEKGQVLIVDAVNSFPEITKISTQESIRCINISAHFEDNPSLRGCWNISEEMLLGRHVVGDKVTTRGIAGPRSGVVRCEWGYAMTVHKAQGSEWGKVVVIDHGAYEKVGKREWNYVAITRAKNRITVIRLRKDSALLL